MFKRPPRYRGLPTAPAGLFLAVAVLAVAVPIAARGLAGTPAGRARPSAPTTKAAAASTRTPAAALATAPKIASRATPSAPVRPKPAPAPAPAGPSLDAYRGLGSWIDIYEDRAWNDPAGTVNGMARRGVRTLFIETSNSRSPYPLKDPAAMATFIRTAHANKMRVVAWYLADLKSVDYDNGRIRYAVGFRTSDGQRFDSFALDIESDAVKDVGARNRALQDLSTRLRTLVGPRYPLGAIIPSPAGLSRDFSSWSPFPYTMLAGKYDVFVPMAYYTWHGKGNAAAYADALKNIRIIRAQKGSAKVPIHMIGGLAEESSPSEVRAFVQAGRQNGVIGASLYSWTGTSDALWQQLKLVKP